MKKIKEYLVPTLVLFIICFIAAVLLGLTNKVTAPTIEANALKAQQEAMQTVIPDAYEFGESLTDAETGCTYAAAKDENDNVIGYAVTATGKGGYGGEIEAMVGIDSEGKVTLVQILDADETASIGGKLTKDGSNFLAKFKGIFGSAELTKNGGTIDAVSGATKTSTGITDAVNNALICYNNVKEAA